MKSNLEIPAPTDQDLIGRCLDGDHPAYRLIVERYQGMVCGLAYSACGNLARSEEVAQEVFIAAWKQLSALQDPAKLPGWLAGITRNLVHNAYRRQMHSPTGQAVELGPDLPAEGSDPREQAISADEARLMWRALESLPEKYREPMVLFYREQQSVGAVALALDLSEENVRQRLARGRAQLTERMAALVGDALGRSAPTPVFAGAVMLALPLAVAPTVAEAAVAAATGSTGATAALTGAGGAAAGLGKGATFTKAASAAGFLPVLLAAVLDFLQFRSTYEAQDSGCARRRVALGHLYPKLFWGVLIGGYFLLHTLRLPGRPLDGLTANQFMVAVILLLLLTLTLSISLRRWSRRLELAAGFPAGLPAPPVRPGAFVHRSTRTLLGLPLWHVNLGGTEPVMRRTARGWIAVTDGIALGGFIAVGGQLAVGPLGLAPVALGLVPLGVLSAGVWAVGLVAAGLWAVGGFAGGWFAAKGGIVMSAHVALGQRAYAPQANDAMARAYFQENFLFGSAEAGLKSTLAGFWFVWVPSLLLIGWYLWRRRREA